MENPILEKNYIYFIRNFHQFLFIYIINLAIFLRSKKAQLIHLYKVTYMKLNGLH